MYRQDVVCARGKLDVSRNQMDRGEDLGLGAQNAPQLAGDRLPPLIELVQRSLTSAGSEAET